MIKSDILEGVWNSIEGGRRREGELLGIAVLLRFSLNQAIFSKVSENLRGVWRVWHLWNILLLSFNICPPERALWFGCCAQYPCLHLRRGFSPHPVMRDQRQKDFAFVACWGPVHPKETLPLFKEGHSGGDNAKKTPLAQGSVKISVKWG